MMGLPTETMEDLEGIANLAQLIVDTYYSMPNRVKGKSVKVTVSVATFVPKPFTPFQWEPQDKMETVAEKQKYLRSLIKSKKINLNCHEDRTSFLEAVFARGDRRLADVIETAWRSGCHFDSWDEGFDYDKWMIAFENAGIDPHFYANRKRNDDEIFPWDHIDFGVKKAFLLWENKKAYKNETSPNCREACGGCGASKFTGGKCCDCDKNTL